MSDSVQRPIYIPEEPIAFMIDMEGVKFLAQEFFNNVLSPWGKTVDPQDKEDWSAILMGYLIGRGVKPSQSNYLKDMIMEDVSRLLKEARPVELHMNGLVW